MSIKELVDKGFAIVSNVELLDDNAKVNTQLYIDGIDDKSLITMLAIAIIDIAEGNDINVFTFTTDLHNEVLRIMLNKKEEEDE